MKIRPCRLFLQRFLCSQTGAASLEAVLWTPIFLILFGMLTDSSILFGRQAEILRIIQDSNRSLAVGAFEDIQQATDYISNKVEVFSENTDVNVAITNGIISSSVTVPAGDLTSTGLFSGIDSLTLTIGASQMSELE